LDTWTISNFSPVLGPDPFEGMSPPQVDYCLAQMQQCLWQAGQAQVVGGGGGAGLGSQQALAAAVNATALALGLAVEAAENALANNPSCAGLFEINSSAPNPLVLLAQIASNNDPQVYFTEAYLTPIAPGLATNAITQVTSYSMQNGAPVSTGVANNLVVGFNYTPGTFNGAGVTANAVTVLHELGHVYEYLYGLGSTLLVDDSLPAWGNNVQQAAAASAFNTSLVKSKCFPGAN
jgi:hypothetical protein